MISGGECRSFLLDHRFQVPDKLDNRKVAYYVNLSHYPTANATGESQLQQPRGVAAEDHFFVRGGNRQAAQRL